MSGARSVFALAVAMLVVAIAVVWVATPSASDVQVRAAAAAASHHVQLLAPHSIPTQMAAALVSAEDERFYVHHGVDLIGVGRSLLFDLTHRCACEGGSTITQQLVKVLYLGGSDRGYHKIEGMILAYKVENILNKRQIMADYLSVIYLGDQSWGAAQASCRYFHQPLGRLTLPDYALLAGLPQAPTIYDPLTNPAVARRRRQEVLVSMAADGYISGRQLRQAEGAPLLPSGPHAC